MPAEGYDRAADDVRSAIADVDAPSVGVAASGASDFEAEASANTVPMWGDASLTGSLLQQRQLVDAAGGPSVGSSEDSSNVLGPDVRAGGAEAIAPSVQASEALGSGRNGIAGRRAGSAVPGHRGVIASLEPVACRARVRARVRRPAAGPAAASGAGLAILDFVRREDFGALGLSAVGAEPTRAPGNSASTIYQPFTFDATPARVCDALDANNLGVDGASITVGVISNSFNANGYSTADLGYGTVLPQQSLVSVLNDTTLFGTDDEGRAMMQVIHDIAPGASLDFCTALGTAADFANGIEGSDQAMADAILALAAAGCKVICDDYTPQDEPWFQSGVVANAIRTIEQEGVTYVSCAGNQGSASSQGSTAFSSPAYQSAWSATPVDLDFPGHGDEDFSDALNFGNGPFQTLTLAPGAECALSMQWAQPWGAATTSLGLVVSENGEVLQGSDGDYGAWDNSDNPNAGRRVGQPARLSLGFVDLRPQRYCGARQQQQQRGQRPDFYRQPGRPATPRWSNTWPTAMAGRKADWSISGENAGTVSGWHEVPRSDRRRAADAGNTSIILAPVSPLSEFFSGSDAGTQWL